MRRPFSWRTAILAVGLSTIVGLSQAAEPSKQQCIDTNAEAQTLQKQAKLLSAQSSLQSCATAACPAVVRDDCARRLNDLERMIPSVIFEVKTPTGTDVANVKILMDGRLFREKLDGTAIQVDPGEHTFRFEVVGEPVTTKTFVVTEGQQGRREGIVVGVATIAAPPVIATVGPAAGPPSVPMPARKRSNLQQNLGLVVGAAGLVGVGLGGVFGLLASSKWSDAKANCSSTECRNYEQALVNHDDATSLATGSNLAFIAGGVMIGTGIILYVSAPRLGSDQATIRVRPTLAGALVDGTF